MWNSIEALRSAGYWLAAVVIGASVLTIVVKIRLERLQAEATAADRTTIAQLKQKQEPRLITLEQRRVLVAALAGENIAPIVVATVPGDAEAQGFAEQIATALKAAGLDASDAMPYKFPGLDPAGIHVVVHDTTRPAIGTPVLLAALKSIGIQVDLLPDRDLAPDRIQLLVGHKRP